MDDETSRRDFLTASATGFGLALGAGLAANAGAMPRKRPPEPYRSPEGFAAAPLPRVRIGFVGVGLQGGSHVRNFLRIDGVDVRAICDIDEPRAREVRQWVTDDGRPAPDLYIRGETDWKRLCERDDIDLVFNSTPWKWHVPACVEAMKTGKHTAVEVPAAITIDGCWELVVTAERARRPGRGWPDSDHAASRTPPRRR